MANIIFTNKCNINCPYCFADEHKYADNNNNSKEFDTASIWELSSFMSSDLYRFCGGEPTNNPELIKTIRILLKQNKFLNIMTNGIWPDSFIGFIHSLPSSFVSRISFLFNILEQSFYKPQEWNQLQKTLEVVNPNLSTLGFTIYKKDFNFNDIIDLSQKYNIRSIRWSIAAPTITGDEYTLENDYSIISDRVIEFINLAKSLGIETINDCCYIPPCKFDNDKLLQTMLSSENMLSFKCGTASPLDIDKDGNAWRCYGLYPVLNTHIRNFSNESEVSKYFNRRINLLKNLTIDKECETCSYWQKACFGGCYAIRVKKALKVNPNLCLFPIDDDNEILNCICTKKDSVIEQDTANGKRLLIGYKVIEDPEKNMMAFLNELDSKKTVGDLINQWQSNFDNIQQAKATVVNMCRMLFELDAIDIKYNYDLFN